LDSSSARITILKDQQSYAEPHGKEEEERSNRRVFGREVRKPPTPLEPSLYKPGSPVPPKERRGLIQKSPRGSSIDTTTDTVVDCSFRIRKSLVTDKSAPHPESSIFEPREFSHSTDVVNIGKVLQEDFPKRLEDEFLLSFTESQPRSHPELSLSEPQVDPCVVKAVDIERILEEDFFERQRDDLLRSQLLFSSRKSVPACAPGRSSIGPHLRRFHVEEDESSFFNPDEWATLSDPGKLVRLANQSDFSSKGRGRSELIGSFSNYEQTMLISKVLETKVEKTSDLVPYRWDEPRWSRSASEPCSTRSSRVLPDIGCTHLCSCLPATVAPLFEDIKALSTISKLPERSVQVDPNKIEPDYDFPWDILC
jgi:hypothetical protein